MKKRSWVLCPKCNNKTRVQIYEDTIIQNFPLYCPKCKQETVINIQESNLLIVKEPSVKT